MHGGGVAVASVLELVLAFRCAARVTHMQVAGGQPLPQVCAPKTSRAALLEAVQEGEACWEPSQARPAQVRCIASLSHCALLCSMQGSLGTSLPSCTDIRAGSLLNRLGGKWVRSTPRC
jgi:hypothetical protein